MRTNRAGQSALLLLDVIEILKRENIDYVVIGAFALAAHAVVRASSDVDALLYISCARLTKLSSLCESAGFTTTLRPADADDPILGMLVLGFCGHDDHHVRARQPDSGMGRPSAFGYDVDYSHWF